MPYAFRRARLTARVSATRISAPRTIGETLDGAASPEPTKPLHWGAARELGNRAEGRTVPCVQLTDLIVEDEMPGPSRADSYAETGTEALEDRKTMKKR